MSKKCKQLKKRDRSNKNVCGTKNVTEVTKNVTEVAKKICGTKNVSEGTKT